MFGFVASSWWMKSIDACFAASASTAAGVFFIDVLSSTDRAYQCSACYETFDLKDTAEDAPVEDVRPARDLAAELLAEKRQREAAVAAKSRQIDDELAALKRKLGK